MMTRRSTIVVALLVPKYPGFDIIHALNLHSNSIDLEIETRKSRIVVLLVENNYRECIISEIRKIIK